MKLKLTNDQIADLLDQVRMSDSYDLWRPVIDQIRASDYPNDCPFTHSHTRHFCQHILCRDS